jgi:hypothetical protein
MARYRTLSVGDAGLRGVIDEVVGEQLVEQFPVAGALDLLGVAPNHVDHRARIG